MCACALVCVCVCVRDVFVIYDNNILPRRIMIIIKIISLNFIEIARTGDFPSTGTRLVEINSSVCEAVFTIVLCFFAYTTCSRPN